MRLLRVLRECYSKRVLPLPSVAHIQVSKDPNKVIAHIKNHSLITHYGYGALIRTQQWCRVPRITLNSCLEILDETKRAKEKFGM